MAEKGRALFLKDFQTFNILSFEKSVEEMILRPKVFSFGNLDLLMIFLDGEEGDLPGVTRERK